MALAIALSPLPIIAATIVLATPKARANGTMFVVGWLAGLGLVGAAVLAIAGPEDPNTPSGATAEWVSWAKLMLGVLLAAVGVWQFARRSPAPADVEPSLPRWTGALERFTPVRSLGAGTTLAAASPKNLLLVAGGIGVIAGAGGSTPANAIAYSVFAAIGTLGVFVPLAIHLAAGDRSDELLARVKRWMARNSTIIMSLLCFVIGLVLIGAALRELA